MKSSKRELLLMVAPLLFVGVAAMVLTQRERQRRERESGPYRTVVTRVEVAQASPFDQWCGYNREVRVYTSTRGKPNVPTGTKESFTRLRVLQMWLQEQNKRTPVGQSMDCSFCGAKPEETPVQFLWSSTASNDENQSLFVLRVPDGSHRVHLTGSVQLNRYFGTNSALPVSDARPAPLDARVGDIEASEAPIDRPGLVLLGAEAFDFDPGASEPSRYPLGINMSDEKVVDTAVVIRLKIPAKPADFPSSRSAIRTARFRLVDAQGRLVTLRNPKPRWRYDEWSMEPSSWSDQRDGTILTGVALPLKWVPASRGPLFYDGYV